MHTRPNANGLCALQGYIKPLVSTSQAGSAYLYNIKYVVNTVIHRIVLKSHFINAHVDADAQRVEEFIQIGSVGDFREKRTQFTSSNQELNGTGPLRTGSFQFSSVLSLVWEK